MTGQVPATPGRRRVLGASVAGISTLVLPAAAQASSVLGPSSAPSAPTITSAVPAGYLLTSGSADHGAIQVTWGAVTGATSYQVKYRTPSGGGSYTTFGTSTSDTSLVVTGLDDDPATQYDVVVVASNDGGTSEDSLSETAGTLIANGGTVTSFLSDGTVGTAGTRYVVHEFTDTGDSTLTVDRPGDLTVDHLVVGGGGDGGATIAGGGGAGEFVETLGATLTAQSYSITVGAGGGGGSGDGATSSAFGVTAFGGGAGGGLGVAGRSGGSGGGAGAQAGNAGGASNAADGDGNIGGAGSAANTTGPTAVGGGGGGSGGLGGDASGQSGGDGGAGWTSSLTGAEVAYAGGGGGGVNSDTVEVSRSDGPAGFGAAGGGRGGYWSADGSTHAGTDADSNSGSGGGGGGNIPNGGGAGGSGIVVLRYALPDATT